MLITNATLITWGQPNRILADHAVLIENDRIKEIGKRADLLKKISKRSDARCMRAICHAGQYLRSYAFLQYLLARLGDPRSRPERFSRDSAKIMVASRSFA